MDRFERYSVYLISWGKGAAPASPVGANDPSFPGLALASGIGCYQHARKAPLMSLEAFDRCAEDLASGRAQPSEPTKDDDDEGDVGPSERDRRLEADAHERLLKLILAGGKVETGGRSLYESAGDEIVRLNAELDLAQAGAGRWCAELQQAKEALEQTRALVDGLRDADGVLRREVSDARDELGAKPGETLRDAARRVADELMRAIAGGSAAEMRERVADALQRLKNGIQDIMARTALQDAVNAVRALPLSGAPEQGGPLPEGPALTEEDRYALRCDGWSRSSSGAWVKLGCAVLHEGDDDHRARLIAAASDARARAAVVMTGGANPADGLSPEDAETLSGAGWWIDGDVWRSPHRIPFDVRVASSLEIMRAEAKAVRERRARAPRLIEPAPVTPHLSPEDAETLRGAGWTEEPNAWHAPHGTTWFKSTTNMESLRHEAERIRSAKPAPARGTPGKATGAEAAGTGENSVAEEPSGAQGGEGETPIRRAAALCRRANRPTTAMRLERGDISPRAALDNFRSYNVDRVPDADDAAAMAALEALIAEPAAPVAQGAPTGIVSTWDPRGTSAVEVATEPARARAPAGLPKPKRVEVGQRWRFEVPIVDPVDLVVEGVQRGDSETRVSVRSTSGRIWFDLQQDWLLNGGAWTFLGPAPTPEGPSPKRDDESAPALVPGANESSVDPNPRSVYAGRPVTRGNAEPTDGPTARDAVAGMLLRCAWTSIGHGLVSSDYSPQEALSRLRAGVERLVAPDDDDRACIAALEALARGDMLSPDEGARWEARAIEHNVLAERAARERDEARAEAAALREEADKSAKERGEACGWVERLEARHAESLSLDARIRDALKADRNETTIEAAERVTRGLNATPTLRPAEDIAREMVRVDEDDTTWSIVVNGTALHGREFKDAVELDAHRIRKAIAGIIERSRAEGKRAPVEIPAVDETIQEQEARHRREIARARQESEERGAHEEAPPGMRIEKREDGEWLINTPTWLSDCNEQMSVDSETMCCHHVDGYHVANTDPDEAGVAKILARWPIAPPQDEPRVVHPVSSCTPGDGRPIEALTSADDSVTVIVRGGVESRAVLATVAELLGLTPQDAEGALDTTSLDQIRAHAQAFARSQPELAERLWSYARGVEMGERRAQARHVEQPEQAQAANVERALTQLQVGIAEGERRAEEKARATARGLVTRWSDRAELLRKKATGRDRVSVASLLASASRLDLAQVEVRAAFGLTGERPPTGGPAPETHDVDLGCARPTHSGPEASCRLCHPEPVPVVPGEPSAKERAAMQQPDTWFQAEFGTLRRCIDCRDVVAGGPTRCMRCVDSEGRKRSVERAHADGIVEGLRRGIAFVREFCGGEAAPWIERKVAEAIEKASANVAPAPVDRAALLALATGWDDEARRLRGNDSPGGDGLEDWGKADGLDEASDDLRRLLDAPRGPGGGERVEAPREPDYRDGEAEGQRPTLDVGQRWRDAKRRDFIVRPGRAAGEVVVVGPFGQSTTYRVGEAAPESWTFVPEVGEAAPPDVEPVRAALRREAEAFDELARLAGMPEAESARRDAASLRRAAAVIESERDARLALAVLGFEDMARDRVLGTSRAAAQDGSCVAQTEPIPWDRMTLGDVEVPPAGPRIEVRDGKEWFVGRWPDEHCNAFGPSRYLCVVHFNGEHVALGTGSGGANLVLDRWPITPASPPQDGSSVAHAAGVATPEAQDERWQPGAVWEYTSPHLGSDRYTVDRIVGDFAWFAEGSGAERATMTRANGWRYVGPNSAGST